MASSEGSAHSKWRRFFGGAGGADIFQIIDAAVAVAALDRPAELEERRERIVQRLYTGGILSCGGADDTNKGSISTPMKGRQPVAESKKDDAPSTSSAGHGAAGQERTRAKELLRSSTLDGVSGCRC